MPAVTQLGLTATPTRRRTISAKRQKPINRVVPQLTTLALTATTGRLRTITPKRHTAEAPAKSTSWWEPITTAVDTEDDELIAILLALGWI